MQITSHTPVARSTRLLVRHGIGGVSGCHGRRPDARAARWIELQQEIIKQDFFTWETHEVPGEALVRRRGGEELRRPAALGRRFYPPTSSPPTATSPQPTDGAMVVVLSGGKFAGEGLTISAVLDAQVAERPDQTALQVAGIPLSYRQLAERSASAAAALSERGVGPGVRVAIFDGHLARVGRVLVRAVPARCGHRAGQHGVQGRVPGPPAPQLRGDDDRRRR